MRFVHIADLHLGKWIHQYSLLDIQKELLSELLEYMDEQDIRLLIIAGDVYDRLIPSLEAVNVLDEFLSQAMLKYHIEVMMISGNHDSSDRLHFASSILDKSGLHIETYLKKNMVFYQKEQTRFYLLPFVKPSHVRNIYSECDAKTYQEALEYYLSKQSLDHNYQNVLITHQFVGHQSIISDSELPVSLGGSEVLNASLFDDFDYVALGHLHAPQYVTRETIRYSGSLMAYSFDEVKQRKSITIVDTKDWYYVALGHLHAPQYVTRETIRYSGSLMAYSFDEVKQRKSITIVDTKDWLIDEYILHPSYTLKKYKGTFEKFSQIDFVEKKDDLLSFELEDEMIVPHAMEQLRVLYPRLLQVTYSFLTRQKETIQKTYSLDIQKSDPLELFEEFYQDVKNQELSSVQKEMMQELLEKAGVIREDS